MPVPLSLTARTLYAELRELAISIGLQVGLSGTPGTVVNKHVRNGTYVYFQYRDLDGRTKQAYLGPEGPDTRQLADRLMQRSELHEQDLQRLEELRGAFVAAGGHVTDHAPMRVLKAFADAGLLHPSRGSIVLVGTHAFNAIGNLLGTRWDSQVQTQDIDLAGANVIDLAVETPQVTLPSVLENLGMGFIPVPALDPRSPSTSYRVRGRELRVDLLTPLVGRPRASPVPIKALQAAAQPLRYLDYVIENPLPTVIVGRKLLVLANVPAPERFALHKLLVAESRPSASASKSAKDRMQATQLLQVLIEEAPDGIAEAKSELIRRGSTWRDKLDRAIKKSRNLAPDAIDYLAAV